MADNSRRRRRVMVLAGLASLALVASGCSGGDSASTDRDSAACADYQAYQGHDGTTVSAYGSIRDVEEDLLNQAWDQFEKCTGINIEYEGSGEFEAQLQVRVDGNNAPDLAFVPQPGLVTRLAGKLKPAAAATRQMADQNYAKDWLTYGTVNGTFYGAPLGSNVKSYVWYSPGFFKEKGYQIPQTWDDLVKLSDQIAGTGIKPWCVGAESGDATGWPLTDWTEDIILRDQGPEVYDQWVNHQIPFNDPKVAAAVDRAGAILKNTRYVNGGYGDARSIATTAFQEGGTPILENKCALHRQASFYANFWPEGTKIAEDGDVFVFYLPPIDPARGKPLLVAGEFTVAFADRPEVQAAQTYLASPSFANSRAKLGNWLSASKGLDANNLASPVDKLSVQLLQDPNSVLRFDGSDMMPAAVGAGTFWRGMVDWITGKDTRSTLDFIEGSWPK